MAITQLQVVKELPYLVSNAMALLTCLPMAVGILAFGKAFSGFFENRMLLIVGSVSYEIYLVHAFTLGFVNKSIMDICLFVILTCIFAYILHVGMGKIKNDRFDSCNFDKK